MSAVFKEAKCPFEYSRPLTRCLAVYASEPARAEWGWDGERLGWVAYVPSQRKWVTWQSNGSFVPSEALRRTKWQAAALLGTLREQAERYKRELRRHRVRPRRIR